MMRIFDMVSKYPLELAGLAALVIVGFVLQRFFYVRRLKKDMRKRRR